MEREKWLSRNVVKIEAVTVCVGYADFLAETVKFNAGLLDRLIVITEAADTETREVCRRHSLQVLVSEDHRRGDATDGGNFNKGRLIERGLQHLSADGWRLHIDADVVLPNKFRHLLNAAHLDERNIYGCDRVMVKTEEAWKRLQASHWLAHDYHCRVSPPAGFQIGSRWAHHDAGYVPIGFFQLWHSSEDQFRGSRVKPYPVHHNDACRTDVQHALQWDRRRRDLIPELLVVHLESEVCRHGANWKGRTTKRFGPKPVPNPDLGRAAS